MTALDTSNIRQLRTAFGPCWIDVDLARAPGVSRDDAELIQLIETLIRASDAGVGQTLKSDHHSRVMRVEEFGRSWVIKRYPHRDKTMKMRLYHALRRTLVWREWHGARRLAAAGLRVSVPVALVHDDTNRSEGLRQHLVLPYAPGSTVETLLQASTPIATRMRIARAIGQLIGRMSAADLRNADLKPSNLIIDATCLEGGEPIIIDPTSIRRRRSRDAVFRTMLHLLKTCEDVGVVRAGEQLACLKEALRADPSLRPPGRHRLADVARAVKSLNCLR